MSDIAWWVYLVYGIVGIGVGWWIGSMKGYPVLGALLGVFTFIGWIIMWMIPARQRPVVAEHAVTARPDDLPPGSMPPHPTD